MLPGDLQLASFNHYPLEARKRAVGYLDLFRRTPLSFLPLLLQQVQRSAVAFPAEKTSLDAQLRLLHAMDASSYAALVEPFAGIELPAGLASLNWVDRPQYFTEQLTVWLWSQHQIDRYHGAAETYQHRLQTLLVQPGPAIPRWTAVMIGHGVPSANHSLFRKLAPYGTLFTNVDPVHGREAILAEAAARAQRQPSPYAHWYIDGNEAIPAPSLTTLSYAQLVPAARREFELLNQYPGSSNPSGQAAVEAVSSYVAALTPEDLTLHGTAADAPLRHFEVSLLTQGAGCQIFSTTFVQWAARECLHRAQPLTLVVRFGNRQKMAPMEQLLSRNPLSQLQDPQGSLVDADMGAYYTWINQSRLPGNETARFFAWWEDQRVAIAIAPGMSRGTTSAAKTTMQQLMQQVG